jgi:hypothetical protein
MKDCDRANKAMHVPSAIEIYHLLSLSPVSTAEVHSNITGRKCISLGLESNTVLERRS